MAENFYIHGYDGSGWNTNLTSSRIGFCGSSFGSSIPVGTFQSSTHSTDGTMSTDSCSTEHVRNCKYSGLTTVTLHGGSDVTLNTSNVGINDCTTRWQYQDTEVNTSLSNVVFYVFNTVDPLIAPTGITVCAFEVTASAVNKDRSSDTAGDGGAWDSSKGIGGLNNALILSSKSSSSIHNFYIGISVSPASKGLKTAFRFRLDFDVQ